MSLLKMLSFGVDIHRMHHNKEHLDIHYQKCKECGERGPCLKARDKFPSHPPTFLNYINYVLFPGTLLAGPPITYNSFHSFKSVKMNCNNPIPSLIRIMVAFELFQMYTPVSRMSQEMGLVELEMVSLGVLMFIWFKFTVIWRWAKVWSYLEGVEVIDNMNRCVLNNYGF